MTQAINLIADSRMLYSKKPAESKEYENAHGLSAITCNFAETQVLKRVQV